MPNGDQADPSQPHVELAHCATIDCMAVFTHDPDADPRQAIGRTLNREPNA
jgi:hypothetical protein